MPRKMLMSETAGNHRALLTAVKRDHLLVRCVWVLAMLMCVISVSVLVGCTAGDVSSSSDSQQNQAQDQADMSDVAVKVAAMKGPTAIGLSEMIRSDKAPYDFDIVGTSDEIVPKLAAGDLDIALIPANLAATLYNKTEGGITVIDVNTMGVLYAVTANEELKASAEVGIADLVGYTVYMTGKGTVPEYTVDYLLQAAGLDESAVNVEFKSEPSEVMALISADSESVGILPQPYATSATIQNESLQSVMDLSEQWDNLTAEREGGLEGEAFERTQAGRLVTGVTVVRSDFLEARTEAVEQFLADHAASVESVNAAPQEYADLLVELGIIGNAKVAQIALPLCNIVCLTGADMKDALSGYLNVLYDSAIDSVGGALPGDDFYYMKSVG